MLPYRDHTVNIPSTSIEVERGRKRSNDVEKSRVFDGQYCISDFFTKIKKARK